MRISDWSSDVCSSDLLGIGVRPGGRADDVEGVVDVGVPVPKRLVHRILQRLRAGFDGADLGAKQPHAEDVGLLPGAVERANEDGDGQADASGDGPGGAAGLARARLREAPGLANAI